MKSIITQNSKLKKTSKELGLRVFNFGITAYKTSKGKITCPFADACIKFCYAKKGAYIWSNVAKVFEQRYELTKQKDFKEIMKNEIIKKKVDFLRVHDSGDFYSNKYFLDWMQIAKSLPNVKFYAYTNSISIVKNNKDSIPQNFDFIFSDSGKQVNLIDKNKDRHTKIFKNEIELKNEGYIDASKIDLFASKYINPNNNKVGLIYH
tara:strand:+ start:352 stop:969 length:618 start_codon:yes stop_codon:yes gene_type:complete